MHPKEINANQAPLSVGMDKTQWLALFERSFCDMGRKLEEVMQFA
ncbi:hypothetical protein ALP29_201471 [Pseudomonas syringae pv. avii]|uniref:Uncharacterized protein n=1 Tax=Pseudomonas syringae pv. avii TaxID=663959 RepID=A0A3M5VLG8_PSESX|nr:hypothetical protein ALP29_201471 [Pseudomonas syringae pv. avii]